MTLISPSSRQLSNRVVWPASRNLSISQVIQGAIDRILLKVGILEKVRRQTWEENERRQSRLAQCSIVDQQQAPAYLKRPYILSGYLVGGTFSEAAWRTCFGLNNETLNAWTMLPACVFAIGGVMMAREQMPSEAAVFWVFLLSCLPHAPFAIQLHLSIGTSEAARNICRTWDIFFIFTCSVPRAAALGWYVFQTRLQYCVYMTFTAAVYLFSIYNCMIRQKIKDIPKASLPKAIAFSIMCFSIPGLTASFWEFCGEGFGELCQLYSLILLFVLIGGLGYGCKIPERWAPGRFDFIGNGHQLMHVAASLEYGLELMFIWTLACRKLDAAHLTGLSGHL